MMANGLFSVLVLISVLLIGSLILFFIYKIRHHYFKLSLLSQSREKADECLKKNRAELAPFLATLYGEQANDSLEKLSQQHQQWGNLLILSFIEHHQHVVPALTQALDILHKAHVQAFSEASKAYQSLVKELQSQTTSLEPELKQTFLSIAQLFDHEIHDNGVEDRTQWTHLKERIESSLKDNQNLVEEAAQYMDLIEQLRVEKKDMRQTIHQALQLLEKIHQHYVQDSNATEEINFKQFNYEQLLCAFQLNESN